MGLSADEVRAQFLEFFHKRGHEIVPPSPVVPYDDPTLLFTNAGMNQFKDVFLGAGSRPYRRAADTQPCIRAGGKHNDLDDVGHDTYHHTFFEMLGNWSFGDYFKEEAIRWAWELLTGVWGLDKSRLHATYFGGLRKGAKEGSGLGVQGSGSRVQGSAAAGGAGVPPVASDRAGEWELEPDYETRELWTRVTDIDPAHVHPGGMKDNFWEMGESGPCGPCSEIHIDLTPDRSGGPLVNAGDPRVIEIWNLVFIQFNREPGGALKPLPARHVDTGMGLERVAAVLQGHNNNYATDVFVTIIQAIERLSGHRYGNSEVRSQKSEVKRQEGLRSESVTSDFLLLTSDLARYASFRAGDMRDTACRVIADHIRALTFAISDGCLPDKEGRGYVLRRILRRAFRYGWQYLDVHEPFLHKLVPAVVEAMGEAFPNLRSFAPSRDREGAGTGAPLAYFITFHTYGTWLHGRAEGSVDRDRNEAGTPVLPGDTRRESLESEHLSQPPVTLSAEQRATVACTIQEVAEHRGWTIHALEVRTSHVHVIVSAPQSPERIMNDLKSYATRRMVEGGLLPPQTCAWAREGSTRYLWKQEDIVSACRYVNEGQGGELPGSRAQEASSAPPLSYGRGSDPAHGRGSVQTQGLASDDANVKRIAEIIREEEESFARTLERGLDLFEDAVGHAVLRAALITGYPKGVKGAQVVNVGYERRIVFDPQGVIPVNQLLSELRARYSTLTVAIRGEDAFKLHDTFGFPIDLTEIMAGERGLTVDIGEYERLMEEARQRARDSGKAATAWTGMLPPDVVPEGTTDDSPKYGRETLEAEVRCILCFHEDGKISEPPTGDGLHAGQSGGLILDRTCFYAEQGGQVGDRGVILTDPEDSEALDVFEVENTIRAGDIVVHVGRVRRGSFGHGEAVFLRVDPRRTQTKQNHTATHLLNWALRAVLDPAGEHLQQKGSLVDPEKTRFDFSHPRPVTIEEIERIEALCTQQIRRDLPVETNDNQPVARDEALKINGLRAVFGEKYPDRVRVVSIGVPVAELLSDPANPEWRKYSIEFCGGTHVRRTGEIERFVLTHEEAVAKGVRRLVGVSGQRAKLIQECGSALLLEAAALREASGSALEKGLARLQKLAGEAEIPIRERVRLRAALTELQERARQQHKAAAAETAGTLNARIDELVPGMPRAGGTTLFVAEMPEVPIEQLKGAADRIKQKCKSAAVLLGVRQGAADTASSGGKVLLLAALTEDLIRRGIRAGDWVKAIAPVVEGAGGGPPTMAQAGGKNAARLGEALEAGRVWIAARL